MAECLWEKNREVSSDHEEGELKLGHLWVEGLIVGVDRLKGNMIQTSLSCFLTAVFQYRPYVEHRKVD